MPMSLPEVKDFIKSQGIAVVILFGVMYLIWNMSVWWMNEATATRIRDSEIQGWNLQGVISVDTVNLDDAYRMKFIVREIRVIGLDSEFQD